MPKDPKSRWVVFFILTAVLPLLYVASLLPLEWLVEHRMLPDVLVSAVRVYMKPFGWTLEYGPDWWRRVVESCLDFWM